VQAIGGVNQKIEGHYDVCRLKGLNGSQGVMIPRANLRNLMLRSDVVEAVKSLTGISAGARDGEGKFPEGSINARVEQKLRQFTEQQKKSGASTAPQQEAKTEN
jgi:predicted ATP-dependent protease